MVIEKKGEVIASLEDWFRLAPPQNPKEHWKDDRSAKETAKAWLQGQPKEVNMLFSQHSDFQNVCFDTVEPEALISFDNHGTSRHADLAVSAHDGLGRIAITVEAKADEEFDQLVSSKFANALDYSTKNPRSQAIDRIRDLSLSLFSEKQEGETRIASLRYQLLTSVAGTLKFAEEHGAYRAVLVVHEFVSAKTSQRKLNRNQSDLVKFYCRIAHKNVEQLTPGVLYGPISVPGVPLFKPQAEFYIGKAIRQLGTPMP